MDEIVPGIFHWTAVHDPIGSRVSSYYVEPAGALVDPKVPEGGLQALQTLPGRPEVVLLSSGHHLRDARQIADTLGIPIRALAQSVQRAGADAAVEPVADRQQAAPGITAIHVGVIADDEGALYVEHGSGALVIADGINHTGEELAFFPDWLLGDDPDAVKDGLRRAYARLLDEYDFDALLFAHGAPIATGGETALRAFTERESQTQSRS